MPKLRRFKWGGWAAHSFQRFIHDSPEVVAFDTETTGIAFHDAAFCVTASWRDPRGEMVSTYIELADDDPKALASRVEMVRQMLDTSHVWVFHNAKFDLQKLELGGMLPHVESHILHDTQTIFNLLDENSRKALKILAKNVLGEETDEDEKLKVVRRKLKLTKDDGYHLLPREVIVPYAMKDTEFTLRLYEKLWPELEKRAKADPRLLDVYAEEIEVSEVLRRMEAVGIYLDLVYLRERLDEYSIRVMEGWGRLQKITGVSDPKFPNSPKQLLEAFEARGVTLASTAESVLKGLDDALAIELLKYRSDKKMYSTYFKALESEQVNGMVHPWFNPTGARTGRMSSGAASA
jgi:DNA polymerase I-like protein with 3'-5' exonuclease and polymerase domains